MSLASQLSHYELDYFLVKLSYGMFDGTASKSVPELDGPVTSNTEFRLVTQWTLSETVVWCVIEGHWGPEVQRASSPWRRRLTYSII